MIDFMATHLVNLDALIQREDMEIEGEAAGGSAGSDFLIGELASGQNMLGVLRKPDFQRETSDWKPEQITELVKNFLDEELVPAIILWKSPSRIIFVIDGAHRLSALTAWVNDDYGDRQLSQQFWGTDLPSAQKKAAAETRKMIEAEIGSYQYLKGFIQKPEGASPLQLKRSRNIVGVRVVTQWVVGAAGKAEGSFYKINQGGAVIDETEKEIIRARRRPEALAARSLLRAGTGHKYWWSFQPAVKSEIEFLAKEIYDILFKPEIQDPIRTLELPMAGRGYAGDSLAIIYEFIHVANDLKREDSKKSKKITFEPLEKDDPKNDKDGSQTINLLKSVKNVALLILSNERKSLGLHPAVYSYSATGRFQPTAFFAQVVLARRLEREDKLVKFTQHRKQFEDFLVSHKYFVNLIINAYGSMTRGLGPLSELHKEILAAIEKGKSNDQVRELILKNDRFSSILKEIPEDKMVEGKRFSKETKGAIRLREALATATLCSICGARYHPFSNTVDHIVPRREGGTGNDANGQVAHPYCNTGFKEKHAHQRQREGE